MADYETYTKAELIEYIKTLEFEKNTIDQRSEQYIMLNSPLIKYLDNWLWYLDDNTVIVNNKKINLLDPTQLVDETPIKADFFSSKIHPEHIDEVKQKVNDHLSGKTPIYEAKYKIKQNDDCWAWYYDRGIVTKRDKDGNPLVMIGFVFDFTEERQKEEIITEKNKQLLELLQTDYLTGTFNRRSIFKRLHNEIEKVMYHDYNLGLIMLDVDDFKWINDTYGHLHGDAVLTSIAGEIKEILTSHGYIGRFGGEEFLVILPQKDESECLKIAEQIRQDVQSLSIKNGCLTTISCGLTMHNGEDIDTFIEQADKAMYEAKKRGKNQVVSYTNMT